MNESHFLYLLSGWSEFLQYRILTGKTRAPSGAQTVTNLPAVWETRVRSLIREDSLEKGMVTHSGILAWRIPWIAEPDGYSPWGCKESDASVTFMSHFT